MVTVFETVSLLIQTCHNRISILQWNISIVEKRQPQGQTHLVNASHDSTQWVLPGRVDASEFGTKVVEGITMSWEQRENKVLVL
jgi:hypothetical protein